MPQGGLPYNKAKTNKKRSNRDKKAKKAPKKQGRSR